MKPLNQILGYRLLNELNGEDYPQGFFHWLQFNHHIWEEFERYALVMADKRHRYSARTIIEVMRWDSDIRQKNELFKLSNNMTPGLARLWMHKWGRIHKKFFQINNT